MKSKRMSLWVSTALSPLVAVSVLWGAGAAVEAQEPLGIDVPSWGGMALVSWPGGTVDELEAAAGVDACNLRSVWVTANGRLLGHLVGAPAFVNEPSIPDGAELEAQPLLLVCQGLYCPESTDSSILDYAAEASGYETPREALDSSLSGLGTIAGTFVVGQVSDDEVIFELVAHDGTVIGHFYVGRPLGTGWLLSSVVRCFEETE